MEWLTKYYTTIDCKQKTLVLVTTKGESLVYKGSYPNHTIPLISAWFKAWRTTKFCARLPEVVPWLHLLCSMVIKLGDPLFSSLPLFFEWTSLMEASLWIDTFPLPHLLRFLRMIELAATPIFWSPWWSLLPTNWCVPPFFRSLLWVLPAIVCTYRHDCYDNGL